MSRATAIAHSNIALVKYWGKRRDSAAGLNLPEVGSISITLGGLSTRTTVEAREGEGTDAIALSQAGRAIADAEGAAGRRMVRFLDLVRRRAGRPLHFEVQTDNDFPTGAGLASSASGFAALAVAACRAADLALDAGALSALARQGSGSAARSLFGGFVELSRGTAVDGVDCVARPLAPASAWPLEVLVAVVAEGHKDIGSTDGMTRTAETSPYYAAWASSHAADMDAGRAAIGGRDFARLAEIAEHSCFKMHGLMLSANPGLLYWQPTTVAVIEVVRAARAAGLPAFVTIDAGPQVKVVCLPDAAARVHALVAAIDGVKRVIRSGLGEGARLVEG